MQNLTFNCSVKIVPGSATIECPDLGYIVIEQDIESAIAGLLETIQIDPALADVPESMRKAVFNLRTGGELSFQYSPELLAAIFAKVRKRRDLDFAEIATSMGVSAPGAIAKYFSPKKPTSPNMDTLMRLLDALHLSIRIGC